MPQNNNISAPVIGISRFRVGRDGNGITTLVAFQGCPLRCKYCINPDCWKPADKFKHYTPQELYDELKKDDLYFRSTEGGVTFGGGEPVLRADFIVEFRKICGSDWKIRIETSINCEPKYIEFLAPVIDEWIIDTKAEKPPTYLHYTGGRQSYLKFSLQLLTEQLGVSQEKITLKVPIIPDYVSEDEGRE
ncbi:MAG: radical SAM protein [Muribaculaceae bacterium]|nr:radical SAM protein [Muribaculaceae bacterium]